LKLLDQGYTKATRDIAYMINLGVYPSRDKLNREKFHKWLKLAAAKGDAKSAQILVMDIESGKLSDQSENDEKMWIDICQREGDIKSLDIMKEYKDKAETIGLIRWHEVWSKKDCFQRTTSLREIAWLHISGVQGYKKDWAKAESLLQEALEPNVYEAECMADLLMLYSLNKSPLFSEEKSKELAKTMLEINVIREHKNKKDNFHKLKNKLDLIDNKKIIGYICFYLKYRKNLPFEGEGWVGPGVVAQSPSPVDSFSQLESLRHWLFESHWLEDKDASWELGLSYLGNNGLKPNKKDAMIYLNAGAQTTEHLNELAQLYLSDDPEIANFQKGQHLLEDLSNRGVVAAKFNLALELYSGTKLNYAPEKAYELWLDVATSGKEPIHRRAQLNVAILLRDGIGVPKNEIESFAWVIQGAASGEGNAIQELQRYESIFSREISLLAQQRSGELSELIDRNSVDKNSPNTKKEPIKTKTGTGAFVSSSGHVLTAAHVVEDTKRIEVIINSVPHAAQLVKMDSLNDIAVLKLNLASATHLSVTGGENVRLGSPIFTLGFPNPGIQGVSPKITRGEISSINGPQDDPKSWQVSAPVQSGNSGGPLFDLEGRVVGMIQSKLGIIAAQKTGDLPQNVAYAVKGKYLLKILADCGVPYGENTSDFSVDSDFERMVEKLTASVVLIQCY
jgi:S1-C subfamily serine protease